MDSKINMKNQPSDIRSRNRLIYSLGLTLLLCLLGGGNPVISILAMCGFFPLILHPDSLIGPVLFTTIFDEYVLITENQSLGRYVTLFFIVGVIMKLMFSHKRIKINSWFIITVIVTFSSIILSLFGIMGYTSVPFAFIFNLIFFLCLINCPIASKKALVDQLWYFAILATVYATWFMLQNGLSVFDEGRVNEFEETVNANTIAVGLAVLSVIILAHFLMNNFKSKTIHSVLFLGSVFLTFLTGSRTALIAIVITMALSFIYWLHLKSKITIKALFIMIASLVALIAIYNVLLNAFPELMDRFTVENVVESGGTGRVDVWETYMNEYFPDYWLFGIGFDPANIYKAVESVNGIGHGAHNILIDILASMGVAGLILYLIIFTKTYKTIRHGAKKDLSFLLPFAMLTVSIALGIGENVIRGRFLWFAIGIAVILSALVKEDKSSESENKGD